MPEGQGFPTHQLSLLYDAWSQNFLQFTDHVWKKPSRIPFWIWLLLVVMKSLKATTKIPTSFATSKFTGKEAFWINGILESKIQDFFETPNWIGFECKFYLELWNHILKLQTKFFDITEGTLISNRHGPQYYLLTTLHIIQLYSITTLVLQRKHISCN